MCILKIETQRIKTSVKLISANTVTVMGELAMYTWKRIYDDFKMVCKYSFLHSLYKDIIHINSCEVVS